jgi:hypothetical protein
MYFSLQELFNRLSGIDAQLLDLAASFTQKNDFLRFPRNYNFRLNDIERCLLFKSLDDNSSLIRFFFLI